MAGPDIDLDFDDLTAMVGDLGVFVKEFEELGDKTDDVQEAVGRPHGDQRLYNKVGSFESGWDGNREVILDGLTNIHDHLKSIVDGFKQRDEELAKPSEEAPR
ncbi:hypothetical protein MUN74_09235 [Agromyces endophyticus]|uniref:hypothetical protein n=1 Tax=Agromyces sp. H17E-10 TaxID=2932244 RepID=UPI001FD3395D|nr:hypothetical protein [Agromyces sp. H17E-10]UOQ91052.1 hypothetical protein MUN74_09235 [Agromyces sp. H17E-10]